jgi:hypothetical protein
MKTTLKTHGVQNESSTIAQAPKTRRCTKFLIGWMKRFGNALNLFVFPSNNKEYLNL